MAKLTVNPERAIYFQRLEADSITPTRATEGSVGFDLYYHGEPMVLTGNPTLASTGVSVQIPEGYGGFIMPRSGLAKRGVRVHPGTIDWDYRGELFVLIWQEQYHQAITIEQGDRIAQLVVHPVMVDAYEAFALENTARGSGGFGSTGT